MSENPLLHQLTIDDIRRQLEVWRRTAKKRTPIPSDLWEAAAGLCDHLSVNHVARALHLNHTKLKTCVEQRQENAAPPAFIELPTCLRADTHTQIAPLPAAECVVKMENCHGERLLMQFKGNVNLDLLELGKSFWRRVP